MSARPHVEARPPTGENAHLALWVRRARRYAQRHGYAPTDAALREEQQAEQADSDTLAAIDRTLTVYAQTGWENL